MEGFAEFIRRGDIRPARFGFVGSPDYWSRIVEHVSDNPGHTFQVMYGHKDRYSRGVTPCCDNCAFLPF